jgi:hypothetical protein
MRSPASPPSFSDSAEVLQKQAFLEPPDFCGGAPRAAYFGIAERQLPSKSVAISDRSQSWIAGYVSSKRRPLSARLRRSV